MAEVERAELGIDGNCGYALLGPNLQEGEAEFVEIEAPFDSLAEKRACKKALDKLRERLPHRTFSYYLDDSYPGAL